MRRQSAARPTERRLLADQVIHGIGEAQLIIARDVGCAAGELGGLEGLVVDQDLAGGGRGREEHESESDDRLKA